VHRRLSLVGDAEVVTFGVGHPRVAVELLLDLCAEPDDPLDFACSVFRSQIKVHPLLAGNDEIDLLDADLESGSVDDDRRICLRCEPERCESFDLFLVIGADFEVVERSGPEAGKGRRRCGVDNDLSEASHDPIMALPQRAVMTRQNHARHHPSPVRYRPIQGHSIITGQTGSMGDELLLDVVEYDEAWATQFALLRDEVQPVLDGLDVVVEHVGSTAVPGMAAKPILDVDFVAASQANVAAVIEQLAQRGYRHKGDRGIAGREMLEPPADLRFHHPYVVVAGSSAHLDHTLFRDYLIEHQEVADEYAELKRTLAPLLKFDRRVYTDAKSSFIAEVLERARRAGGFPTDEGRVFNDINYRWRAPIDPDRVDDLVGRAFDGSPRTNWWTRARPRSLGWVTAHDDEKLVGFVNVVTDGAAHAFILDTAVDADYQRLSIGTVLVQIAEEHARKGNCSWLHVDFEEHLGSFYFDACGFVSTVAGLKALQP